MKWFRSLKVGARLILGFSSILLLMAVVGFVGNRAVQSIHKELEVIFTVRLPSIDFLVGADRDLHQLLVAERSLVFADTGSDIFKQMVRAYEENLVQSEERWHKYKSLPKTPDELAIIPLWEGEGSGLDIGHPVRMSNVKT